MWIVCSALFHHSCIPGAFIEELIGKKKKILLEYSYLNSLGWAIHKEGPACLDCIPFLPLGPAFHVGGSVCMESPKVLEFAGEAWKFCKNCLSFQLPGASCFLSVFKHESLKWGKEIVFVYETFSLSNFPQGGEEKSWPIYSTGNLKVPAYGPDDVL